MEIQQILRKSKQYKSKEAYGHKFNGFSWRYTSGMPCSESSLEKMEEILKYNEILFQSL